MKDTGNSQADELQELRERAERLIKANPAAAARIPIGDAEALTRELQIHQAALRIQSEDLRRARMDITERKKAETTFKESEAQMRRILNASIDMIRQVDKDLRIVWANEATVANLDSPSENIIGQTCYELFTGRDTPCEACPTVKTMETGQIERAVIYKPKAGRLAEPGHWDVYCVPLKNQFGAVDSYIQVSRNITEEKAAEHLIRSLSQQLMQAQERERQMISYELHDRMAQNLSTLKIGCDTLFEDQPAISAELKGKLAGYSALIEKTISAVRDLSYDLRPPGLDDIGIVKALEMYCEEFSDSSGVDVDFQSAGIHNLNLSHDAKIHLYRLVQEGLINIRKHAHATRGVIKLIGTAPNIILRVEDNGKGFDVRARELALDNEKRMGLRSMRERVNLLQGQMSIRSRPMGGTKIFIKFPYGEQDNEW